MSIFFLFFNAKKNSLFAFYYKYLQQLQDPYFKKIKSQLLDKTDDELRRHNKILKGNYAIIGMVIGNVFFPERPVSSTDLKVIKFSIPCTCTYL